MLCLLPQSLEVIYGSAAGAVEVDVWKIDVSTSGEKGERRAS